MAATLRQRQARFDLVVVGAGISGAGVARDATLRGLSTLVIDARDVAYGTSSRSTRLIHGGVRYLEQAQIGLVYEALRERARLYTSAEHLVRPVRFLFPSYRGDRLSPFKLRVGLSLYDLLNRWRSPGFAWLSSEAARMREPLLSASGLRGAAEYEDAVTDDARLTLSVLQSARDHGAEVATYTRVESISREPTGEYRLGLGGEGVVFARAVVVAAGPWASSALLGEAGRDLIAQSKGVHVVVRADALAVRAPLVVQVRGEDRIIFVVPWGARTYIGTTDTHYEGDPGISGIDAREEDELLSIVRGIVPSFQSDRRAILSAWSGVRPLVRSAAGQRRARHPGSTVGLARTHRIVERSDGVLGLVGGKLTTYRAMAEEAVDRVVRRLAATAEGGMRPLSRCSTHNLPLVPGAPLSPAERTQPIAEDLVARHGPRTRALLARCREQPALATRLVEDLPYRWVEVEHAITHEGCVHVEDVLRRRLPLALTDADLGGRVARRVAEKLVAARGGDARQIEDELERYADSVSVESGRRPNISA